MQQTIEQKVAQTMLQETFPVRVGTKEYAVRPITYGTLIRVSAVVSTLPPVGEDENIFAAALRNGAYGSQLAEIVALCILNRKDLRARYSRRWLRRRLAEPGLEELKDDILHTCTIGEVGQLVRLLFSKMELADFFGVMVSLSGVNLIAETATTASGQPSEE